LLEGPGRIGEAGVVHTTPEAEPSQPGQRLVPKDIAAGDHEQMQDDAGGEGGERGGEENREGLEGAEDVFT
jgi:hypothetical protein